MQFMSYCPVIMAAGPLVEVLFIYLYCHGVSYPSDVVFLHANGISMALSVRVFMFPRTKNFVK